MTPTGVILLPPFPACASNLCPCKKARDTTDPDFEIHNKEAAHIYIFLEEMLFTSTWRVYFVCFICYLCPPQTEQLPVLITLSPYPLKTKLLIENQVMIQAHTLHGAVTWVLVFPPNKQGLQSLNSQDTLHFWSRRLIAHQFYCNYILISSLVLTVVSIQWTKLILKFGKPKGQWDPKVHLDCVI